MYTNKFVNRSVFVLHHRILVYNDDLEEEEDFLYTNKFVNRSVFVLHHRILVYNDDLEEEEDFLYTDSRLGKGGGR